MPKGKGYSSRPSAKGRRATKASKSGGRFTRENKLKRPPKMRKDAPMS